MNIEYIFSLLEKEKKKPKPEKIQKNFLRKLSDDLKKMKNQIKKLSEESGETKNLLEQYERIREIVEVLLLRRLEKIVNISLLEIRENLKIIEDDDLDNEEKALYEIIKAVLQSYKEFVIEKILNGENIEIEKIYEKIESTMKKKSRKTNVEILVITTDLPQKIVGPNGKIYGPLFNDEILIVHKDFADKLIATGIAGRLVEYQE